MPEFVHHLLSANDTENLRIIRDEVIALQNINPSGIHSEHREILNRVHCLYEQVREITRPIPYMSGLSGLIRLLHNITLVRNQFEIRNNLQNIIWHQQQIMREHRDLNPNDLRSNSYNEVHDRINNLFREW